MRFNPDDKKTWPHEGQDVFARSSVFGLTVASFMLEKDWGTDGPGFANWFDRTGAEEDADMFCLGGDIDWWPVNVGDLCCDLIDGVTTFTNGIEYDESGPTFHADPGCVDCTMGVTPDRFNTGLCGYHKMKSAIRKVKSQNETLAT